MWRVAVGIPRAGLEQRGQYTKEPGHAQCAVHVRVHVQLQWLVASCGTLGQIRLLPKGLHKRQPIRYSLDLDGVAI